MSMLVKVGDVWVDPLRVVAVWDGHEEEDDAPAATGPGGLQFRVSFDVARDTLTASARKQCTVDCGDDGEFYVDGATADEAASIINRCREQSMGAR